VSALTNTQGTGTTIVTVTPGQNPPTAPVFFTSQAAGLSEALEVLKSGFVIVASVPTTDGTFGTFGTIGPGSLQVINRFGQKVVKQHGQASLKVVSMTEIGSGYLVQPNPAAAIVAASTLPARKQFAALPEGLGPPCSSKTSRLPL
jgi:hypothetical protein